jgi:hypothetical protein
VNAPIWVNPTQLDDDTRRPNRDHVFNAAARAGRIEPCSLGAASEASTRCRYYRASAVAPGRKWPCRDDRLRSAEFSYGGEDAEAQKNVTHRNSGLDLTAQPKRWRNTTASVASARLGESRARYIPQA